MKLNKFYSHKRMVFASIAGGLTAGIMQEIFSIGNHRVLCIIAGGIAGLVIHMLIVPKAYLSRLREALKAIEEEEEE